MRYLTLVACGVILCGLLLDGAQETFAAPFLCVERTTVTSRFGQGAVDERQRVCVGRCAVSGGTCLSA